MLDMGFREDLEELLDATPEARRTLLFSATMPKPIVALARRYQRDALRISTVESDRGHGDIEYQAMAIAPADIENAVVNLLRFHEAETAMLFCATRDNVRHLHASLIERGFAVVALSGEHSQNERNHALQALRDRRARVCVATDVAARGIDLPSLSLVVHVEIPRDAETLQHRSGRTGRAGKKGTAIVLVPYPRRRRVEAMLRDARIAAEWVAPPSAADIRAADSERMIGALLAPVEVDRGGSRAGRTPARRTQRRGHRRRAGPGAPRAPARARGTDRRRCRPPPAGPARRLRGQRLVPAQRRPPPERRSALDPAAAVPPRPCQPQRDRRDPHRRQRNPVRSSRRCRRPVPRRRRAHRQARKTTSRSSRSMAARATKRGRTAARSARPGRRDGQKVRPASHHAGPPEPRAYVRADRTAAVAGRRRTVCQPSPARPRRTPLRCRACRKAAAPAGGEARLTKPVRRYDGKPGGKPVRRHDGSPVGGKLGGGKKGNWTKRPAQRPGQRPGPGPEQGTGQAR